MLLVCDFLCVLGFFLYVVVRFEWMHHFHIITHLPHHHPSHQPSQLNSLWWTSHSTSTHSTLTQLLIHKEKQQLSVTLLYIPGQPWSWPSFDHLQISSNTSQNSKGPPLAFCLSSPPMYFWNYLLELAEILKSKFPLFSILKLEYLFAQVFNPLNIIAEMVFWAQFTHSTNLSAFFNSPMSHWPHLFTQINKI